MERNARFKINIAWLEMRNQWERKNIVKKKLKRHVLYRWKASSDYKE